MTSPIRRGPSGSEIVVLTEGDTVPVPPGGLGVIGAVLFWDGVGAWVAPMAVGPSVGEVLVWDGAAWTPSAVGPGGVVSCFGRVGAVVAVAGDYNSTLVQNLSTVAGAFVTDALNTLQTALTGLAASDVSNDSAVAGVTVANALNTLQTALTGLAASDVSNDSAVVGVTVANALNTLETAINTLNSTDIANSSAVAGANVTTALNNLNTALASLTSDNIANNSAVVGATVTAALNTLNTASVGTTSNITTGVLSGGLVTAGAGAGQFSVALGEGRIVDYSNPLSPLPTPRTWVAQNDISVTDIATTQFTFVFIDPAGVVLQVSGVLPSEQQRRENILLGTLTHEDNTNINAIAARPDLAYNAGQDIKTITRRVAPFLLGGFDIQPIAASLTYSISAGEFWAEGTNFHTTPNNPSLGAFPAASPAVFTRAYTDGTSLGDTNFNGSGVTTVDPANFDDGGTLTAIGGGGNTSTIQRVYLTPNGNLFQVYGQQTFASLEDAVIAAGQETFVQSLGMALSVVIGRWCLTRTATDTDDTSDAVYIPAPIAGLSGGGGSGTSTVFSIFGRVGIVLAAFGDYLSSQISDDSSVGGTSAADSLNTLLTLATTNLTSGVLSGGNIVNGAGAGEVTISDGAGRILNYSTPATPARTEVSWSGLTDIAIVDIATTSVTFLLITPGGTLLQVSGGQPSEAQYRANISLGWVEHPDNTTITGIGADPQLGYQSSQDFKTVFRALAPFLLTGFDVAPNADLTFALAAGTFWAEGSQFHTTPNSPSFGIFGGIAAAVFDRVFSDGVSGGDTNFETLSTTLVDPTQVETTGLLGAVGGGTNRSTIQRLYITPSGELLLCYGQEVFANLTDAVATAGKEAYTESGLVQQSQLLGRWCVQRTVTDLSDESLAFYIPVTGSGGGGGSAGVTQWVELTDTDSTFAGQAGRVPTVNLLENNLGLVDSALKSFGAADFDEPNNANWAIASIAAINSDPQNTMFVDRTFDDSTPQGVGFDLPIPAGATTLRLFVVGRAQTAPGGAATVTLDLYRRTIPDGAAQTAWTAPFALTAIDIPTSIDRVYDSQSIALVTLGLAAGTHAYFELVRSGGTLVGNWRLTEVWIGFS